MHRPQRSFSGPGPHRRRAAVVALLCGAILALTALAAPSAPPARADTAPPDSSLPTTVSSDTLPTAQIDGVVWAQAVAGNTVFAGGQFTTARPAGALPGTQTVPRSNLLAYTLSTGVLVSTFAPDPNGQVKSIAVSPDGATVYVAGQFTTIAGATRNRIAAFDAASGALLSSFAPSVNGTVYGLAVSSTTVYFGGLFSSVNGVTRQKLAAVDRITGALRPFAAGLSIPTYTVRQVAVSPDGTRVVIGGNFDQVNGSSNPGYGLALLDGNGTPLPMPVNSLIRDARGRSAIYSLAAAPDGVYGSGYVSDMADGNLEGAFKADWNGNLIWLEDCHGDTYSVFPLGHELYLTGHAHYCGNVGGFPQTSPTWTYQRSLAFTQDARGVIDADPHGYFNYAGKPRPALLHWFPDLTVGTFTGQSQAAWSVSGNPNYVVLGGEFVKVNGVAQQGLVRFARTSIAPNHDGPRLSGAALVPTVQQFAQGVRLSWPADYDRDNEQLRYDLIKNGNNAGPIFTQTARSSWWQRPTLSYLDQTMSPGATATYRIRVTDPLGNSVLGNTVSVTATGGPSLSGYDQLVLADGPRSYWRLDETSGSTAADLAGNDPGTSSPGVTPGQPGGIAGDPGTSYGFDGSTGFVSTTTARPGLQTFTIEAWFNTTSTRGGKLVGFGSASTGNSTDYDRHILVGNSGRLYYGVWPQAPQVLSTPTGYRDGRWHQVVATLSPAGMALYVDGALIAQRSDIFRAETLDGYWRIGGDSVTGWAGAPTSPYLNGRIDDVAVYPVALSPAQVAAHWTAGRQP